MHSKTIYSSEKFDLKWIVRTKWTVLCHAVNQKLNYAIVLIKNYIYNCAGYGKSIWNHGLTTMHILCIMKSTIYIINSKDQKRILKADNKILNFIREFFFF